MNRLFFYVWNLDNGAIVHEERENIKLSFDGGIWHGVSEGFTSEAELYEGLGILENVCKNCDRPVLTNYTEPRKSRIIKHNICNHCIYWFDIATLRNDPCLIVTPRAVLWSNHETVKHNPNYTHKIQKLTGEIIHTSSIWLLGIMPKRFNSILPVNAEIIM